MARIQINFPEKTIFTAAVPVRITDLNYGNHVGNDAFLSLMHEARMQLLGHFGWSEINLAGTGIIMADAALQFRKELGYGDPVYVDMAANAFTKFGFDIYYRIWTGDSQIKTICCLGKTGIVCFDYGLKKISTLPEVVRTRLSGQ